MVPHSMRATAITNMTSEGVGEVLGMKTTGHKSVKAYSGYAGKSERQNDAIANLMGIGGGHDNAAIVPLTQLRHQHPRSNRDDVGNIMLSQQNTHNQTLQVQNSQQNQIHYSSPNKKTSYHYNFAGATINLGDGASFILK
jgi:hypothetical protein